MYVGLIEFKKGKKTESIFINFKEQNQSNNILYKTYL